MEEPTAGRRQRQKHLGSDINPSPVVTPSGCDSNPCRTLAIIYDGGLPTSKFNWRNAHEVVEAMRRILGPDDAVAYYLCVYAFHDRDETKAR
ncbi:hypothetical protein DHEL01_v208218 [Diaporthe helianthi]|uniref:Uncharacterized protein n=1 Tax=Diaporthe helianthi TaxID=158607 RepID=A0A2P5HT02_DIAHE|nr:hypothetical protein DHEL01_v208218 [Diaporthe helianthi]